MKDRGKFWNQFRLVGFEVEDLVEVGDRAGKFGENERWYYNCDFGWLPDAGVDGAVAGLVEMYQVWYIRWNTWTNPQGIMTSHVDRKYKMVDVRFFWGMKEIVKWVEEIV